MQQNRHAASVWRPPSSVFRACWPTVHLLVHRCLLGGALRAVLRLTVRTAPASARARGPVVVVANHASHLDAPLLLTTLPRGLRRIAVAAAADYFFTTALRSALMRWFVGAFPVHRERGAARQRTADALLGSGWSVLLFPEGTRSRDGALGELRPGAAALCVRAGVPCLPVRIEGTFGALAAGRRRLSGRRPRVEVSWGTPLSVLPGESVPAFNERIAAALIPPREEGNTAAEEDGAATEGYAAAAKEIAAEAEGYAAAAEEDGAAAEEIAAAERYGAAAEEDGAAAEEIEAEAEDYAVAAKRYAVAAKEYAVAAEEYRPAAYGPTTRGPALVPGRKRSLVSPAPEKGTS